MLKKLKQMSIYLLIMMSLAMLGCTSAGSSSLAPEGAKLTQILERTKAQLSEAELSELTADWLERGTVETKTVDLATGLFIIKGLHETGQFVVPSEFVDQEVYIVTFPSKIRELVGDVQRVVDPSTGKIIGYSLRD